MTLPAGSMKTRVGHAPAAYCRPTAKSLSFTTGCSTPCRATALRTLSVALSDGNLAECTPMTTISLPYLRSSFRN